MFEPSKGNGRWQMPKLSLTHWLGIALALSLAFSGYLLSRRDVRAVVFSPGGPNQALTPTAVTTPVRHGQTSTPTAFVTPDLNTLLVQLQDMQGKLQLLSSQLEQKSQGGLILTPVAPIPGAVWGSAAQTPVSSQSVPAMLAEIEQLYQVMQPLMVQLDVASRAGRPASELEAMRAQMAAIHQRLDYLLDQVEIAKSQANP